MPALLVPLVWTVPLLIVTLPSCATAWMPGLVVVPVVVTPTLLMSIEPTGVLALMPVLNVPAVLTVPLTIWIELVLLTASMPVERVWVVGIAHEVFAMLLRALAVMPSLSMPSLPSGLGATMPSLYLPAVRVEPLSTRTIGWPSPTIGPVMVATT